MNGKLVRLFHIKFIVETDKKNILIGTETDCFLSVS